MTDIFIPAQYEQLERNLNYSFTDKALLRQALTHPSNKISSAKTNNYERLEFLGDSILDAVVADILFKSFEKEAEGNLSKRKSYLVSRDNLANIAKNLQLDEFIILHKSEETSGGRNNKANLENCFEALCGAIYLDSDFATVFRVFADIFAKQDASSQVIESDSEAPSDIKNTLQEYTQKHNMGLPTYDIVAIEGEAHKPQITVSVTIADYKEQATAKSRKAAEKLAAKKLLDKLKNN